MSFNEEMLSHTHRHTCTRMWQKCASVHLRGSVCSALCLIFAVLLKAIVHANGLALSRSRPLSEEEVGSGRAPPTLF